MRIGVDLDGTICPIKHPLESYADLQPLHGAVERLRQLRQAGHYIIIVTARNMATCEANVGRVMRNVGKLTLDWLEKHGVEYDELHFGKPNAEVYIDDRAIRFRDWADLDERELKLQAQPR